MAQGERDRTRRRGLVRPAELPVPKGAPSALWHAARRERVRRVLGPKLGGQLVALKDEGDSLVLEFAGSRWERVLEGQLEEIAPQVLGAASRTKAQLVVRSRPDIAPKAPPSFASVRDEAADERPPKERLRELARKLLERRADPRT